MLVTLSLPTSLPSSSYTPQMALFSSPPPPAQEVVSGGMGGLLATSSINLFGECGVHISGSWSRHIDTDFHSSVLHRKVDHRWNTNSNHCTGSKQNMYTAHNFSSEPGVHVVWVRRCSNIIMKFFTLLVCLIFSWAGSNINMGITVTKLCCSRNTGTSGVKSIQE